MRYEVTLTRPAYEVCEIEIEAVSVEAAEEEAHRLAEAGELEWRGGDTLPEADEKTEVIEVREMEEP